MPTYVVTPNLHLCVTKYNQNPKRISQGLKYVELSFKNNNKNDSGKGDLRKSTGGVSVVNSDYIRHSDYFPGGMDSANTEATLISRNTNGGSYTIIPSFDKNNLIKFGIFR